MTRLSPLVLICVVLGTAQGLTATDASAQTVVLDASFDSGADGFSYQDDAFRSTNQPAYASGAHASGGLTVTLGNLDNNSITNMSGGWEHSFSMASGAEIELSFQYKLTQAAPYESDEYAQALVELDGVLLGQNGPDYIVQITGDGNSGSDLTTGWVEFRQNVGTLGAGIHTLRIGAFNNKKTYNNEWTELLIDDVMLASPAPPPPPNLAGQALVDALSLQSFKDHIQLLSSLGSRHWTQPGNQTAVDYIVAELESYGYTNVVLHPYTYSGQTRYNVYATRIGSTNPDEMYIVSSHLDSKTTDGSGNAAAAGADDDASGTSLVLEAARVFADPSIETDYSIRFAFWNNEETGLNGSAAYVNSRQALRGQEDPPGSGLYPEPHWRGMLQHDMILYDHGMPPGPTQSPTADIDIEYQASSTFGGAAIALANAALSGNNKYATDYPAEVTDNMSNTDSARFQGYTAAVSIRENRRLAELGNGSNPNYHTDTDVYESYSDADFLFGFNVAQTTVGTVAEIAGASLVAAGGCGNGVIDAGEQCDDEGACCSSICLYQAAGSSCEDGDLCSANDSCNATGVCISGAPTVCDDGQFCNGSETCDSQLGCVAGTAPNVDDGVACTVDSCDEVSDSSVHAPNNGLCNNGQFCDGAELCNAASGCQAGTPPVVDDGIVCTQDSCDEVADLIVNAADDSLCDNGLFCDGAESCTVGLGCQAGTDPCAGGLCDEASALCPECQSDLDCADDGNDCTDELCSAGSCQSAPNASPCDDGDACTDSDQCSGGVCAGTNICLADATCYLRSTQVIAYTFFQEAADGARGYAPGSTGAELGFTTEILVDENGAASPGVRKNDPTTGAAAVYAMDGDGGSNRHTARVTLDPVDVSGLSDVSLTVVGTPLDSGNGFETADYMKIAVRVEDAGGQVNELVLIDTTGQDMDTLGLTGVPFDTFTLTLPAGSVQATVVLEGSRSGPSEEILFDSVSLTALGVDPAQDQLLIQAEAFDSSTVSGADSAAWLIAPDEVGPSDDVYTNALDLCNVDDVPRYVQSLPDAGRTHKSDPFGSGPVLSYQFEIVQGGTYRIWVRAASINSQSDSFYMRVRETDGGSWWRWNPRSDRYNGRSLDGDFTDEWQGSGAFGTCTAADAATCAGYGSMEELLAPGLYTLDIAMREDGSAIDAIVLDGSGTFAGTDPTAN